MSDSLPALRQRIKVANDLGSVVKTMKAMAAASISQFEQAALALEGYSRSIELCLRTRSTPWPPLITDVLSEIEREWSTRQLGTLEICHNRALSRTNYEAAWNPLLPLDRDWEANFANLTWPMPCPPNSSTKGKTPSPPLSASFCSFLYTSLRRIPRRRKRGPPRRDAARRKEYRRAVAGLPPRV